MLLAKGLADVLGKIAGQLGQRLGAPHSLGNVYVSVTYHGSPNSPEKVVGLHQSAFVHVVTEDTGAGDVSMPSTAFLAFEYAHVFKPPETLCEHVS